MASCACASHFSLMKMITTYSPVLEVRKRNKLLVMINLSPDSDTLDSLQQTKPPVSQIYPTRNTTLTSTHGVQLLAFHRPLVSRPDPLSPCIAIEVALHLRACLS